MKNIRLLGIIFIFILTIGIANATTQPLAENKSYTYNIIDMYLFDNTNDANYGDLEMLLQV